MENYGKDKQWPFAEGGESTLALMTGIWAAAAALRFLRQNPLTTLLFWLITPLWLLILWFFRDPNRDTLVEDGLVVSPGDGELVEIIREPEKRYLNDDTIRLSIFLSIVDVHVQRVPISGRVTLVEHRPGQFLQAFRPEASEVNEYIAMITESAYGRVLTKQIAGILARRCVNHAQVGDWLTTGQRFGLIKFSSRVDLFLPPDAELLVRVGDKVYGGLTPIARLRNQ
ncbi:MAG: phosphatidylserine decarboxylase family protein [Anaerolineae bacterium]|nr:phosphatidylserine decarboxylase family protein [Anaerolineae bacterium]